MATRCLIIFKMDKNEVQFYKHWDGYPETTVPELVDFLAFNMSRNHDFEYACANFAYWYKSDNYREHADETAGLGISPKVCKTFDEARNIYGSEYVYILDFGTNQIFEINTQMQWNIEELNGIDYDNTMLKGTEMLIRTDIHDLPSLPTPESISQMRADTCL